MSSGIIHDDLSVRERVDKEITMIEGEVSNKEELGETHPDSRSIYPNNILIWSVIGTPYAVEISSGNLYHFPEYRVGREGYSTTSHVYENYSVQETDAIAKDFSDEGYEIYGWKVSLEYQPNITQLPRRLSILDNNDNEIDFVALTNSSRRIYSQDYLAFHGERYEIGMRGRLVGVNMNGSAEWYPFTAKIRFNM